MSKVSLGGSPTGTATFDIVAPATNTNRTITLPDSSGQVSVLDLRTAVTASGTAVDFLNIPATARRITVMFNGVSTTGTSPINIQIGSGSIQTTAYGSYSTRLGASSVAGVASSTGFAVSVAAAVDVLSGAYTLMYSGDGTWVGQGVQRSASNSVASSGQCNLSGPLDRIRITTVNGTDTFDAGTINIMVE